MSRIAFPLAAILAWTFAAASFAQDTDGLDKAYREWHAGFFSPKKEVRIKTLRSMCPTKDELKYMFPNHVEGLWPRFEKHYKLLEEQVDEVAKEIAPHRTITEIKIHDARKGETDGNFERLFAMIPKDVPVCKLSVRNNDGGSSSGCYLRVKGRWLWMKGAEELP